MSEKKKCFIITPIGEEKSEIRRHIEGIIDAAIAPVVSGDFKYDIEVAHRIDAPGNIPKQVVLEIFKCDLAIVNLTGNNPNVMYELALRHCFGKPVIIIAEEGTKLPADITGERTIFYVNDALGVIELRKKLESTIKSIQESKSERLGPIYEALKTELKESAIIEEIKETEGEEEANIIKYLISKIDNLQYEVRQNNAYLKHANIRTGPNETHVIRVHVEIKLNELLETQKLGLRQALSKTAEIVDVKMMGSVIRIGVRSTNEMISSVVDEIEKIVSYYEVPIRNVSWREVE